MISIQQKILVSSLVVLCLSFASAQKLEERIDVQLVQVDLVAMDSKGALITDLKQDEFTLKENGKVQPITSFYNSSDDETRYPLTISFVVDTSYSMHEKVAGMTRIEIAVTAAEMIVNELKSEDQVELIEFNNEPKIIVPFTSDIDSVLEKFETLDFREANTAMYDALVFSLQRISGLSGRKIIVVFSDGMDSASKLTEDHVIDALKKSDATLIAFYSEFARINFPSIGGNPNSINRVRILSGEDILREFAEVSGGQFFSFRKEPELLKAMETFRGFVQSQYTLAYKPPAGKKGSSWRKIKVECKRKGVKLRHRQGYWAG